MQQPIHWFEIPSSDYQRAIAFYEQVFAVSLRREDMGPVRMAVFPYAQPHASGAVVHMENLRPGSDGPLIYLDGGDDLNGPLQRARGLGAEVLLDKMSIGENGFIAIFRDCEGNRVGLHSMQ